MNTDKVNSSITDRRVQAQWNLMQSAKSEGIQGIMDMAAHIFDSSLYLLDSCFRLIYSSETPTSTKWKHIQSDRNLDMAAARTLIHENTPKNQSFYAPFYADSGICKDRPIIMGELIQDQLIIGHIIISLEDKALLDDDLALTSDLIYILQLHLDRKLLTADRWHKNMAIRLQDLIILETPNHLRDLAVQTLSENLNSRYAFIVAPFEGRPNQRATAHLILHQLQQSYKHVISMIFEGSIVCLFDGVKYSAAAPILKPENNYMADQLFCFFEQYELKCGLSTSFDNLRLCRLHYHQALFAANLANAMDMEQRSIFLEQMPLPLFLAFLKSEPGRAYLHPVFFLIRNYDRQFHTEYEITLRTYLISMKNKEEAAAKLNIHKNTLQYRLNRIMDLFDLPLDESRTAVNLLCSSLILEIDPSLGDRKPSQIP